jgi:hypothetical protein
MKRVSKKYQEIPVDQAQVLWELGIEVQYRCRQGRGHWWLRVFSKEIVESCNLYIKGPEAIMENTRLVTYRNDRNQDVLERLQFRVEVE